MNSNTNIKVEEKEIKMYKQYDGSAPYAAGKYIVWLNYNDW